MELISCNFNNTQRILREKRLSSYILLKFEEQIHQYKNIEILTIYDKNIGDKTHFSLTDTFYII